MIATAELVRCPDCRGMGVKVTYATLPGSYPSWTETCTRCGGLGYLRVQYFGGRENETQE